MNEKKKFPRFTPGMFAEPRDPDLHAALVRMLTRLTPQHSTTSRRDSIAALFRAELDEPFGTVLNGFSFRGWSSHPLLHDFLPSRLWSYPPKGVRQRPRTEFDDDTIASRAHRCSEAWATKLLEAKRAARALHKSFGQASDTEERAFEDFYDSIELMVSFALPGLFTPSRSESHDTGQWKQTRTSNFIRRARHSGNFCELCWRLTEVKEFTEEDLERQDIELVDDLFYMGCIGTDRARELMQRYWNDRRASCVPCSRRFCREHNPRRPDAMASTKSAIHVPVGSRYRNDLRKKAAFVDELTLLWGLKPKTARRVDRGTFGIRADGAARTGHQVFVMPFSSLEPDLRRAAYALVNARIRGTVQEDVYILANRGLPIGKIAMQLCMPTQNVSRALRSLEQKRTAIDNIRLGRGAFPLWE